MTGIGDLAGRLLRYLAMRRALVLVLAVVLALGATAVGWAWWHYRIPDLASAQTLNVRLFAGSEELIAVDGESRRSQIWVPLAEIPKPVVQAVLAAEDRRFYSHPGVDVLAVLRAGFVNLRHGDKVQGGSTITQQLARTLFLPNTRNWGRKAREAAIALVLEARYSKAQILEAYLNSVYMGHDSDVAVHGVAAASRHFLGTELARVRVDEAALLAGLIRAPNRILARGSTQAKGIRDGVIEAMREQGAIGEVDAAAARQHPVALRSMTARAFGRYFAPLAREEVDRRVDLPARGEVRIATTLDPALQRAAEAAVRDGLTRIERGPHAPRAGTLQAALVAIEPGTGKIRALVGGRRYGDSQYNRAVRAVRQPGSLFKPFVYLAAFEAERAGRAGGLTPASLLSDEPVVISARNGDWSPKNLDGRFQGQVTVRQALVESLNVPTVRVAQGVGIRTVARVARDLGVHSRLNIVPSLALGTSEVNLMEMTAAFAAIANGGVAVAPTALEPDAPAPALIPVRRLPDPVRAVSPESAFLVTYLLRGVMQQGTGAASARWGLSGVTAGKTGTTDDMRDAWFIGYTPDLAVGVWVGVDDGHTVGLTGSQAALPIWAAVMQSAVRRVPPRPFTVPQGIVLASVEARTGRGVSAVCGGGPVITEAFRAGTEPRATCDVPVAVEHATGKLVDWFRGLFR